MGAILEDVYDVLFHPQAAFGRIAAEGKLSSALVVFLISVFVPMWAIYLGLKVTSSPHSVGLVMLLQAIGSVAMWLLGTAVWHLCAELLGGQGSVKGLLAALGFVHFPRILIVPLWVVATWLPDAVAPLFLAGTGAVLAFWILTLQVLAISAVYEISRAKAVLVFLTPVLFFIGAIVLIAFFAGAAMIQWPMGIPN